MAKKLNPMPPSAKAARRTMWVQAIAALLVGGGLLAAHRWKSDWVPGLVDDKVYRVAAGIGAGVLVLLFLTFLMRYQWRWLWLLLLLVELGTIGGLVWCGVKGVNWILVAVLGVIAFIVLASLFARVCRRWFHH